MKRFLLSFFYVRKAANKAKSTQQDPFNFNRINLILSFISSLNFANEVYSLIDFWKLENFRKFKVANKCLFASTDRRMDRLWYKINLPLFSKVLQMIYTLAFNFKNVKLN